MIPSPPAEETDGMLPPRTGSASSCRQCGRETETPERCLVCKLEDEMRAGPDLLAALRVAKPLAQSWINFSGLHKEDMQIIDAAIAKASGQNVPSVPPADNKSPTKP